MDGSLRHTTVQSPWTMGVKQTLFREATAASGPDAGGGDRFTTEFQERGHQRLKKDCLFAFYRSGADEATRAAERMREQRGGEAPALRLSGQTRALIV